MEQKKVINLEGFFTEENERNGVWHEPLIDGEPCGIQFLIIGIHSEEAIEKMDYYDKLLDELQENDESKRIQKEKEIDAERVASITKGIRAADGSVLKVDGEDLKFSMEFMKRFYMEAPMIKMDNVEFAVKSSNFMKKNV